MCSFLFYYTTDDNGERDSQMEIVVISTSEFPMRNVQKHVYPQSHTGTVAAVCVLAALFGLVIGGVYWHHRRRKLADLTGEWLLYLSVKVV